VSDNTSDPINSFIGANYGAGYSSAGGAHPRDVVLQQLTTVWNTAIPMSTQWLILIDTFPVSLNTSILQGLERTDGDKSGFNIDAAKKILTNNANQKLVGCWFAHEVTIPSEQFNVEGIAVANNRGFLPGVLGSNRVADAPSLNIVFKETTTSFIDFVIRPWVILGAHFGLTARPGDSSGAKDPKNIKATVRVIEYTRSIAGAAQLPRKEWVFYNCVPYNVSEETLDYETEKLQTYRSLWTYSNYTVGTPINLNSIAGLLNSARPLQSSKL
jgi:hypothetical protein